MLTGFLKSNEEKGASCVISKFVDRIRVPLKGTDVEVLRHFCICVGPKSRVPLHEIFILTPQKSERITNIENRSDQLLDREDPFNKLTTGHRVGNKGRRALINWDGIPGVCVLRKPEFKVDSLDEKSSLIKIFFNEELSAGDHGALRFKFTIKDYLHRSSRYKREKTFRYFVRPTASESSRYPAIREIKCTPWFGKIDDPQSRRRVPGGFDVFLRHPVDLEVNSTPEPSTLPRVTKWSLDCTESSDERVIGWRLRHLLKSLSPGSPPKIGMGADIQIRNSFDKTFTIRDAWIMFIYSALVALAISTLVALLFSLK